MAGCPNGLGISPALLLLPDEVSGAMPFPVPPRPLDEPDIPEPDIGSGLEDTDELLLVHRSPDAPKSFADDRPTMPALAEADPLLEDGQGSWLVYKDPAPPLLDDDDPLMCPRWSRSDRPPYPPLLLLEVCFS
jgi:hypothetical protein